MHLDFLPSIPFDLSQPLLFGMLLVAGVLGGEMANVVRLPRIVGYVIVGLAIAPLAEALGIAPLIDSARTLVDLALGLVLFDLGRRMDLQWLARDWTLAASSLAESAAAFAAVFGVLVYLDFAPMHAAIAATIAMATSPAVVLLVAQDARAQGQVTERALTLVALNSLAASILLTTLFAAPHLARLDVETAVLHPLYLFVGSTVLGASLAAVARLLGRGVGKSGDLHFGLVAGLVVGAVGLAVALRLSVILSLLAFGLFARNAPRHHDLLNVDLGRASRLLYIVLFVITGASLPPAALETAGVAALAVAGARAAGKLAGVFIVGPLGGLRPKQVVGLAAALLPMSSIALMMQHDVARLFPEFGPELDAVMLGAILVMELVGPLATQWGLALAGETEPRGAARDAFTPAATTTGAGN